MEPGGGPTMKMHGDSGRLSAILLALGFFLTLSAPVSALTQLTWDRIEVDAHLDDAGALHVRERMFVTVEGSMTTVGRIIGTSTDQVFVLRRLVREEGGRETEFAGSGWQQKDRYMWRDQKLTWWIREVTDPEWEKQTLMYRMEYELRNALAPAWDIPATPDPFLYSLNRYPRFFERLAATLVAWGQAPASFDRRYLLEHDVILPQFPEWPVKEFFYTLRYSDAWRRVHPDAEIGHATPGIDYRVTQRLDYLAPGWPPAVQWWKPATRVGSILGLGAMAALLWATFAAGAIRRWGLIPPSPDRRWFEEHIGSQPPEILARNLGKYWASQFVAPFLERLRATRVFAVHSVPAPDMESAPSVDLELLRDPATLQPHERLMMAALFPQGPKSSSALLARFYGKQGFSPGAALDDAINPPLDQLKGAKPAQPPSHPLFWRIVRRLSPWVCCNAAALLVVDSIQDPWPMGLFLTCWHFILAAVFALVVGARIHRLSSGGTAALMMGVAVFLAFTAAVSIHFSRNIPITAPGSACVALVALWIIGALLYSGVGKLAGAPQQRMVTLGALYARRELRKPQPGLDNGWIPHLALLGLELEVAKWRERHAAAGLITSALPASAEPGGSSARPFTGLRPFSEKAEWIGGLYVPSEEERKEEEEAAREDEEDERNEQRKADGQ